MKLEVSNKMKYIPLFLSGVVVVVGLNVFLAMRDSKLFEQIDNRNQQIEQLLNQ
tara:strand:+ start:358 stop:519 length:162 start_codon:yes stop_codon:yes gene_type:complete